MKTLNVVALTLIALCRLATATEPYGLDAMLRLDRLPYLSSGVSAGQQSSYDRAGANNDAGNYLNATYATEGVMLDLKGPGVVYCIWTTGLNGSSIVRAYIDGETQPRLNIAAADFFSGANAPFLASLSGNNTVSSGGFYSYVPLPFASSIKLTITGGVFYHVGYHTYMPNTAIASWSPATDVTAAQAVWQGTGTDPKPASSSTTVADSFNLAAGQSHNLLDIDGPGEVVSIRMRIPALAGAARRSLADTLNTVNLRIFWDNEATASVDAPIGSFFAMGYFGSYPTRSLMVGQDANSFLYCYFPMPFARHARVQLVSTSGISLTGIVSRVRHSPFTDPFDRIGYFNTSYRHAMHNGGDGTDVLWLDTAGSGKFLGVITSMKGSSSRRYLEGDERFHVDDSRTPAFQGTGTEDFFNAGWFFQNGTFTLPMQGNTAHDSGNYADSTAAYRFLLHDAVPFRTHMRASIEHDNRNTGTTGGQEEAWSLAYYYLSVKPSAILSDSLDIGNAADESAHAFAGDSLTWSGSLTNTFEGERDTVSITDDGRANRGSCSFTMAIASLNNGVILRRMFDQNAPIQHAGVTVDGTPTGIWYHAGSNPTHRWREDEFMIPPTLTAGKSRITVALTHTIGTPDWSAFKYWAYSLTDTTGTTDVLRQARPTAPLAQKAPGARYALSVFTMDGRMVERIATGDVGYRAGVSSVVGSSLPAGAYLYRLRGGTIDRSATMTVTR